MIAPVIVVFHEARQGALEFPRAKVLLELDDVLHRPVVAFDLSLRHGVRGWGWYYLSTVLEWIARKPALSTAPDSSPGQHRRPAHRTGPPPRATRHRVRVHGPPPAPARGRKDLQRLGHAGWVTRRDVAGTTRHAPPDAENPQRGFRCSRAWSLAGCRSLPGSRRRFQCRCRRDPSGCRLGEANQDAVFQRVILWLGDCGPRISVHGLAARREAMAYVSALPIDRRRPYRRLRPGARIQPG